MTRRRRREYAPYMRRRPPARTNRTSDVNREAQRSGANAEYLVEQIGVHYEARMLARVRKRYEPYKRVGGAGKNGLFKAVNIGSSGPDFELWLSDGRAGLLEVKSRKGGRVTLSCVGEAQAMDLTRMSYWGHLALVLVRIAEEWYLVDYRAWTHDKKRSLNARDLEIQGARVPINEHGLPDFLAVVEDAISAADRYLAARDDDDMRDRDDDD